MLFLSTMNIDFFRIQIISLAQKCAMSAYANLLFSLPIFIIPQRYLPCAKLFLILNKSLILISFDCVLFSTLIDKTFPEPRDYRVVFLFIPR